METYERVVIRLFEHCGFTYAPSLRPEHGEVYARELMEVPWGDFLEMVVPASWVRSVALHLHDTRQACDDVAEYLQLIPEYLNCGHGEMPSDWQEEHLPVVVSDELRLHVFCLIAFSEFIRAQVRSKLDDKTHYLVPASPTRVPRPPRWAKALSQELSSRGYLSDSEAVGVSRQLSSLCTRCAQTRQAIDEFVSASEEPAEVLIQRFSNVQAAVLDLARVLIEAEHAVDVWGSYVA